MYNKRVKHRTPFPLLLCSLHFLLPCPCPAWGEEEGWPADLTFVDARVADASDRAYEPTAISLIDHAKSSVVMSMYLLKESADARHPVNRLVRDLEEAAQRGVRVELYLNTQFAGMDPATILETPALRRLHDKLLIVDERWVLEGSTNWSVSALMANWESNTLMDSPALAKQKLRRLRQLTVSPEEPAAAARKRPALPQSLDLPTAWIARGGILPRLVSSGKERTFDTLLLLLLESRRSGPEFYVNLEGMALDIGLPGSWNNAVTHQEMIRLLRDLKDTSGAGVDASFVHGRNAWVTLTFPEGPTVTAPGGWFEPASLAGTRAAATYLKLFDLALQRQEGLGITQLTYKELARRTGLTVRTVRETVRALKD